MQTARKRSAWMVHGLDLLLSLLALFVLLPIAGALPSIASEGRPLIDSLWFTFNLGGPFILLAAGLKGWIGEGRLHLFVLFYACVIGALGALLLQLGGLHSFIGGWILMTFYLAALLLSLHRSWLWDIAATGWCLLLLGIWSVTSTISFITNETQQFSFFLPLQILAFALSLVVLIVHLRYRNGISGDRE